MNMKKYICKCCGYYTLTEKPVDPNKYPGTFEICPVCFWEDDSLQFINPNMNGGANNISLNEAKENFKKYRVSNKDFIGLVREPFEDEVR